MTSVSSFLLRRVQLPRVHIQPLLLYIAFFLLGLGLYQYAFLFVVLFYFLDLRALLTIPRNNRLWLRFFLLAVFFSSVFFLGTLHSMQPFNMTVLIIYLALSFVILDCQYIVGKLSDSFLLAYVFGLFLSGAISSIYSLVNNTGSFGYGLIFDPIMGMEVNTPAYSNSLVFPFLLSFQMLLGKGSIPRKLILTGICCLCVLCAVFLGGRAFFIVVLIALVLMVRKKKIIIAAPLLFVSIVVVAFFVRNSDLGLADATNFLMKRIFNWQDTGRASLYTEGIIKAVAFPFGGFDVSPNIYGTQWFHNTWVDSARLGGWIAVSALLLLNIDFFLPLVSNRNIWRQKKFHIVFAIACLAVMFQDVVIGGNIRIFFLYCLCCVLLEQKTSLQEERG
jgi:hypothetical protein